MINIRDRLAKIAADASTRRIVRATVHSVDFDRVSAVPAGSAASLRGLRCVGGTSGIKAGDTVDILFGDHEPVVIATPVVSAAAAGAQAHRLAHALSGTDPIDPASIGAVSDYHGHRAGDLCGGMVAAFSTAAVSGSPTYMEMFNALGEPSAVGAGAVGVIDRNDAHTEIFLCVSNGYTWFRAAMTKPASPWWLGGDTILPTYCRTAYAPKGAASQSASYSNLLGWGDDAQVSAAPGWSADDGWIFAGASALTTLPPEDADFSVGLRFSDGADGHTNQLGCSSDDYSKLMFRPSYDSKRMFYLGSTAELLEVSGGATSGTLILAGRAVYHNGSLIGTIPSGNGIPYTPIAIGARADASLAMTMHWTGHIQLYARYRTTLSSSQVGSLHTAMMAA